MDIATYQAEITGFIFLCLVGWYKDELNACLTAWRVFRDREYDDRKAGTPDLCLTYADGNLSPVLIFKYTFPLPFRRLAGKIKPSWGMSGIYCGALVETGKGKYTFRYFHRSMVAWSKITTYHMLPEDKRKWRDRIMNEPENFDMTEQPWGEPFSLSVYGKK